MKYLFFIFSTMFSGVIFAQGPSIKFVADKRMVAVGDTVILKITKSANVPDTKLKIGAEVGKDYKIVYAREDEINKDISYIWLIFKKIGPINVSITAKVTVDSIPKGKKVIEKIPISLKYEKKGYFLITDKNEYSELNQLFTGGDVDSYIKLVKKASKMVENDKYSKDPFAYIWLARGLYLISGESLDFSMSKYQPYKSAFNDAVSALSKALKYDNNGFLEKVPTDDKNLTDDKFSGFINEMQYKYYDEIVLSNLTNDTAVVKGKTKIKDYAKINTSISKYLKITKNPICVKYLQVACLFNLKDANAKVLLKEAELELTKYIAGKDSLVFSETDELFFAAGICELLKYYNSNKKAADACVLQKRAIAALPTLIENREKFEEFQEYYDEECK